MFVFTMNNEQSDSTVGNQLSSLSSTQSDYSTFTSFLVPMQLRSNLEPSSTNITVLQLRYLIVFIGLQLISFQTFSQYYQSYFEVFLSYNIYKFNSIHRLPSPTSPSSVNPVNTARSYQWCPGRAKHDIISSNLKSEKYLVKIQRKEFESIKMCDASTIGFVTFYLLMVQFEGNQHYTFKYSRPIRVYFYSICVDNIFICFSGFYLKSI